MAKHEIEFTITKHGSYENYDIPGNNQLKTFCSGMVSVVDRFWLNEQFSQVNEITYYNQSVYRTQAVIDLVEHVLHNVKSLLTDSNTISSVTKERLISKIENLDIRVKGLVQNQPKRRLEDWGFKSLPNTQMITGDPKRVFEGFFTYKANSFNLNQVRLMARDYAEFRINPVFNLWEDIEVPYDIVNAWYNPLDNTITIPIGITLVPMFNNLIQTDASTLAVIIGHEIGHSIDNNGRLFDQWGNYVFNNTPQNEMDDGLWTDVDLTSINKTMNCLAKDYGHPCDNENYGYHTMGEDIADQVGVRSGLRLIDSIYNTYQTQYKNIHLPKSSLYRDYFINYAKLWCGRASVDRQCTLVKKDPHALAKHRVNKTLRQLVEFMETFRCRESTNMYKPVNDTCVIYK